MSGLEEKIRELTERGEVTHLSLTPHGGKWAAVFVPAGTFEKGFAEDADPIKALMDAMSQPKLKRRSPAPTVKPSKEEDISDLLA